VCGGLACEKLAMAALQLSITVHIEKFCVTRKNPDESNYISNVYFS
jgi:hypothetical protein